MRGARPTGRTPVNPNRLPLFNTRAAKGAGMARTKLPIIHYDVIDSGDKLFLSLLIDKLQDCITAQSGYNIVRTGAQILLDSANEGKTKIIIKNINAYKPMPRKVFEQITGLLNYLQREVVDIERKRKSKNEVIQSLTILLFCCEALYIIDLRNLSFQVTDADVLKYHVLKSLIMSKASEALGYWNAKSKQGKINYDNLQTKTKKKENKINAIRDLLENAIQAKMTVDEIRVKAQDVFGIKKRSFYYYLKEINEQKKQRIREAKKTALCKNDVSAKH